MTSFELETRAARIERAGVFGERESSDETGNNMRNRRRKNVFYDEEVRAERVRFCSPQWMMIQDDDY